MTSVIGAVTVTSKSDCGVSMHLVGCTSVLLDATDSVPQIMLKVGCDRYSAKQICDMMRQSHNAP